MGRAYLDEIQELTSTYAVARGAECAAELGAFLRERRDRPVFYVGSGGALSAARFMSTVHEQASGVPSRTMTPFELITSPFLVRESVVVIVSASGNNKDIVAAFEAAVNAEAVDVVAFTASRTGKIAKATAGLANARLFVIPLGGKRDGFLAVNSLLSFAVVFSRACAHAFGSPPPPSSFEALQESIPEGFMRDAKPRPVYEKLNISVLFGTVTLPAAIDLESKCTEAGLVATLLNDFRNFGHGRHHWLAKHQETTSVIALSSERDCKIAVATLRLIPKSIPTLHVHLAGDFIAAGIAALVAIFHIVHRLGVERGIDPGRPGVPAFGSKVYSLGPKLIQEKQRPSCSVAAMRRKLEILSGPLPRIRDLVASKCEQALTALTSAHYAGIVLDYDGTIVGRNGRFRDVAPDVAKCLTALLQAGAVIAVCTGRGKSAHERLQACIPTKLQDRVLVCFYNGATCAALSQPHDQAHDLINDSEAQSALTRFNDALTGELSWALPELTLTPRRYQLSLESNGMIPLGSLFSCVARLLLEQNFSSLKCVRSFHSVDIIPRTASKLNAVTELRRRFSVPDGQEILGIGDMPEWPGNDCELLAQKCSLSVSRSSSSLDSGWNFSPPGMTGDRSLAFYLSRLKKGRSGIQLNMDIEKAKKI